VYIGWFNDSRLHENLSDRAPQEIEVDLRWESQHDRDHLMREKLSRTGFDGERG
jgi:hypothetical protein